MRISVIIRIYTLAADFYRSSPILVSRYTLPLRGALKQSEIRMKCENKNQPNVLYFRLVGQITLTALSQIRIPQQIPYFASLLKILASP